MLLIYVDQIGERVQYTFDFVFKERAIPFLLTNDFVKFEQFDGEKFSYSERYFENVVQIKPVNLLFEDSISNYGISKDIFHLEECICFNQAIDPFASIFYILSRMEEYTTNITDKFGRFEGKNSVLYRFEWNEKVVCDRWAMDIIHFLISKGIYFQPQKSPSFSVVPTFDIDNAFAYKNKGLLRTTLATLKDFILGRSRRILERQRVQLGLMKDPYDTYERIEELANKGLKIVVFWLLGDFAKFDRNITHRHPKQRKLIQRLSKKVTICIHPSFKSNSYEFYLHNEIERLEEIINDRIFCSRQHFLYLKMPYTYQTLIGQEIKHDYSMGFADVVGFRIGTSRPVKWFDLQKNKVTQLTLHPFAFMDGTLNEYLKLTPELAKEKISELFSEVKNYGGEFSFIWHNETIGDYGIWKGWKTVFEWSVDLK
jgi:hypothetical protein